MDVEEDENSEKDDQNNNISNKEIKDSSVYSIVFLPLVRPSSGVSHCVVFATVPVLLPQDKTHTVPHGCYCVIVAWRHQPLLFLLILVLYWSRFSSS
jgi:hypothetical protein